MYCNDANDEQTINSTFCESKKKKKKKDRFFVGSFQK